MLEPYDHRSLGRRLELFHFQEEAPGMAFWHPNGRLVHRLLEDFARRQVERDGYREVSTPQILRRPVWEKSGHWEHYREGMFRVQDQEAEAGVKPVSCPGHIQILETKRLSHRDLPVRMAEFGLVHRDEQKGALHGLLRLRQFTQDDGHIFCRPDQAEAEVERFCRAMVPFYRAFGFEEVALAYSTRPEDRAGDEEGWDASERALEAVLGRLGIPHAVQPGAGAFYGPKLEFILKDRGGREWQCGTIQFDLVMPKRFGLRYFDGAGNAKPLVMLHRAMYGSLERFLGMVLEQHGPFLPAWLAPVQARILPVTVAQEGAARDLERDLRESGLRADVVGAEESLGRRMALARRDGVIWVAVLGVKEAAEGTVAWKAVNGKGDARETLPSQESAAWLLERCRIPALGASFARDAA